MISSGRLLVLGPPKRESGFDVKTSVVAIPQP